MASNAEHLRRWLFDCEAIDASAHFGVDWLEDEPEGYALISVPSAVRWTENVLGERRLAPRQSQDFILLFQAPVGGDAAANLRGLAACRAVAEWIAAQSAAGSFPAWEGGAVTGVTPTLTGAPVAWGAGTARYQMQIRVTYRVA